MISEHFRTSVGKGIVWTDSQKIRVVVSDEYGSKAFRFESLKQAKELIDCLESVIARYEAGVHDEELLEDCA